MGGLLKLSPHEAPVSASNQRQIAPNATKPTATTSTLHYGIEQLQEKKAGMPHYHINGLELRWSLGRDMILKYPIQVTGIKGIGESTVNVQNRSGLDHLLTEVRQRRYEEYLKEKPLELVSIYDDLDPWEKHWDVTYDECEGCEEGGKCVKDEDVDVVSATDATIYEDEDAMDVDEELVSLRPCVGAQYVWQVRVGR